MARPACPLCRDNFSVAKVSALCRSRMALETSTTADGPSLAELLAPPASHAGAGRALAVAATVGVLLCVVTGFAFVWLCVALGLGVFAETLNYWNHLQAQEDYQQALSRWQAAYYCGGHDVVFVPGEADTWSPALFGQVLGNRAVLPGGTAAERAAAPAAAEPLSLAWRGVRGAGRSSAASS